MDLGIAGKTALITGAARGLGKADALVLGAEGCKLALIDVLDKINDTAAELKDKGFQVLGLKCDITNREAVKTTVKSIEEQLGAVDICINNAAIVTTVSKMEKLPDMMWDKDIAVNLTGAYNVSKAVYPGMMERGWGRFIFMASIVGFMGGFGQASYSATKIGVVGLARTLALEGARNGITSNAIVPGIIGTELLKMSPMLERMRARVALRKEGDVEDIANAIAFLVSERAKYITGACLHVTGGIDLFTF